MLSVEALLLQSLCNLSVILQPCPSTDSGGTHILPSQSCLLRAVNKLFLLNTVGEVLAFGARAQSKSLLPTMNNTVKSELATQHVTPRQEFMVMTTAGKQCCVLALLLALDMLRKLWHIFMQVLCLQHPYVGLSVLFCPFYCIELQDTA